MSCDHENFVANVGVGRLTEDDAEGSPVVRFIAEVKVICAACEEAFVFIGAPAGMSPRHPMASVDGTELRAPIRPQSAPDGWGEDGVGFGVSVWAPPQN